MTNEYMTSIRNNKNHYRCESCGHSDTIDIVKKESTQERIRIMRRVIRKLCGGDKKRISDEMEEAIN